MKLKKIASLMLAGVMAVSMLAGCATNSTEPENPNEPENPVVAGGISAGVESYTVKKPEYVKFVDDADLSKNLQYVAEFANVKNIGLGYLTEDLHKYSNTNDLQNRLVTVEKASVAIDDIGDTDFLQLAESASTVSIKDATAAQLYVASGVIEENALNTLVAEELDRIIKDYNNVVAVDGEIGLYDHSYTVSVSTCTKAIGEVDVTFVAVQVVRSSVRS